MATPSGPPELISHLQTVLLTLAATPYPEVACPPNVPRRASVAVILRIQPNYSHWPEPPKDQSPRSSISSTYSSPPDDAPPFAATLDAFFSQPWVRHGDPELLFIKRSTRIGDKWNGHVALPGGKRDPEDGSDLECAAREAYEEVGIDLSAAHAIPCGNLPQRVVTSSWGKVPLMVLCPYVYMLTSPAYPAQRLQPTEVASSHWVSLRALLAPALRTHEYADVSSRLAKSELGIKRWFLQAMLSKMMFAAIRLLPSESTYCSSIPSFVPEGTAHTPSPLAKLKDILLTGREAAYNPPQTAPLLLWGLTLGVISDLLEHIPPHNALELWTYPTFTNWDVRFTMWAMSYRFRRNKAREMRVNGEQLDADADSADGVVADSVDISAAAAPAKDASSSSPLLSDAEEAPEEAPGEVGIAGLGVGRHWGKSRRANMIARGAAVNSMLEGYYPIVRKAVALALAGRLAVVSVLAVWVWKSYLRRRLRG